MPTIRVKHSRNYTVVSNALAQDRNLSWQARGMMLWLLSQPDDWVVRMSSLHQFATNGRDASRSILNELIDAGYITKKQLKNEDGTFGDIELTVHESPSVDEEPVTGNQSTDNQVLQSTKKQSTNTEGEATPPRPTLSPQDKWIVEKNAPWVKCLRQSGARVTMETVDEWRGVLDRCFNGEYVKLGLVVSEMPVSRRWPRYIEEYMGDTQAPPKTGHLGVDW